MKFRMDGYKLTGFNPAVINNPGQRFEITFSCYGDGEQHGLFEFMNNRKKNIPYTITITPEKKKRSLDANSYAWSLIQKLAVVLNIPKEKVYREIIRGWGDFYCITLSESDAAALEDKWSTKGIGWIAEPMWTNCGQTCLMLYPGSSTYDTKQMSRFIDAIIEECKEQGIETMTPAELEALKEEWK